MSSSQEPVDPTDRIKGFLARQTDDYLGGPITPKEDLEQRIRNRDQYGDLGLDTLDMWREDLLPAVEAEIEEGDGRTRGLSDVLPPGEYPSGDVYQYVPRRDLREYTYECENHIDRLSPEWNREKNHPDRGAQVGWGTADAPCPECGGVLWSDGVVLECASCIYYTEPCRWSTERRCRGLPTQCPDCGGWVRPEADK